jgi:hypothetical protein
MTTHDRIINELVDALDKIHREAACTPEAASLTRILGLCDYAISRCNAQRERNSDGYLVVRDE